jgi:23S rRNA (pseudouridine1915-N3)-methyltransferase
MTVFREYSLFEYKRIRTVFQHINIVGKQLSSEELSAMLDNAAITGKSTVDFIIGGSYGLSNKVKNRADFKLSMSKMTFPHQMARMVLSEQIYRAFEISTNGKYHK